MILNKLKTKLLSENKELSLQIEEEPFVHNPWNVGDFYAYQFHSKKSKEYGLYNKYIIIQKIGNYEYCNNIVLSKVQIFNHIYDTIPKIEEVCDKEILPLLPKYDDDGVTPSIVMIQDRCGYIIYEKERDYKKAFFTYMGNKNVIDDIKRNDISAFNFSDIESDILFYYMSWKE